MSTSAPSRRLILGTFAALPLAGLPAVLPLPATSNPDAALIALCAEHIRRHHAFNTSGSTLDPEDDPLWLAFCETDAAMEHTRPQTFRGVIAKARVILTEATHPDGSEEFGDGNAVAWSQALIHDILRIADTGAVA